LEVECSRSHKIIYTPETTHLMAISHSNVFFSVPF
jgi:hypothetical protein